jgi:hypothetical protein
MLKDAAARTSSECATVRVFENVVDVPAVSHLVYDVADKSLLAHVD